MFHVKQSDAAPLAKMFHVKRRKPRDLPSSSIHGVSVGYDPEELICWRHETLLLG